MKLAWLCGGICFAGVAVVCWYARLTEFAIGSALVGALMLSESWIKDGK